MTELSKTAAIVPAQRPAPLAAKDPLAEVLAGQLSEHTRRAYRADVAHLLLFLRDGEAVGQQWREWGRADRAAALSEVFSDAGLRQRLLSVTRRDLIAWRVYLKESLGLATAAVNRRLAGVSSVLRELMLQGYRPDNPASGLRGLRTSGEHADTVGLSASQLKALIFAPKGRGLQAVRDRAILALLGRNGLRAAEVCNLRCCDLTEDQGFRIATIHGKGNKTRVAKLAGPTWAALSLWLRAADREAAGPEAPVFVSVRKQGQGKAAVWTVVSGTPLDTSSLGRLVKRYAAEALGEEWAEKVHPHSLRHSFITIALENGASLRRVQYAVGHSDPRTTERYDRARENLADNAADYVTRALHGASAPEW